MLESQSSGNFSGGGRRSTPKYMRVASEDRPFFPVWGGALTAVTVAYETYGKLAPGKDNVILVLHDLTGDSHCAAHDAQDDRGWWEPLVGPGRPIDTDRFFVVCSNVLGSCRGTTGPASADPFTGRPYGARFPVVTVRDMVRVQKLLLEQLGVRRLVMAAGGSMGGAQVLEWAVTYPGVAQAVAVIAAPGCTAARSAAGNSAGFPAVVSGRFDADSYLCLRRALDLYDVSRGHGSYERALARITGRVLVVGIGSDVLYPVRQQEELAEKLTRQGVAVDYATVESTHGHDGFLTDSGVLRPVLSRFVDKAAATLISGWVPQKFHPGKLAYLGARLVDDSRRADAARAVGGGCQC